MSDHRSNPPEIVPGEFPPTANSQTSATRPIPSILAIPAALALCFSPKRIGARLSASSWHASIVAHVVATVIGVAFIAWAEHVELMRGILGRSQALAPGTPFPVLEDGLVGIFEWIRAPCAALVANIHGDNWFVIPGVTLPWVLLGIEVVVIAATLLLMPFAAAGETKRRLFGRCLRLSLWNATMIALLGVGWFADVCLRPWTGLPNGWHPADFIGLGVFAIWWLMVLLRSGYQYAGPPDGPAWTPRTPRCESCGYTIAHLELATRCPECGRPVADSLPERRDIPGEHTAPGPIGFIRFCATTLVAVLTDAQFFTRLAVHRGHARARAFFITLAAFNSILLAAAIFAIKNWSSDESPVTYVIGDSVVIACGFFIVQIMAAGVATCAWAIISKRSIRHAALVCFYALSSAVPLTLAIGVSLAAITPLGWAIDSVHGRGIAPNVAVGIIVACAIVGLCAVLITMTRIARRASADTRFANR